MCSLLKLNTAQKRPSAKSLSILSSLCNLLFFHKFLILHQPLLATSYISPKQTTCTPPSPLFSHSLKMGNTSSNSTIRVIAVNGRVQELRRPVRASELTDRNPLHFICDANRLRVGCRIPGLAPSDELEPGRLYFLLPMDLLYSVLTDEEMAALTCKASRRKYKSYIGRRIFPVLSELCLIPLEAEKVEEERRRSPEEEEVEVSRQRSWRPALDTIEENPWVFVRGVIFFIFFYCFGFFLSLPCLNLRGF